MYQISFNELALNGIVSKPWDIVYLGQDNKIQIGRDDNTDTYKQRWDSVIPSKGVISIAAKSEKQLHYELCSTIIYKIPCIRSTKPVKFLMNNKLTNKTLSKKSINRMTSGMSVDNAQIWLAERIGEKETFGLEQHLANGDKYCDLPDIQWIQLNPSDDLFIIQVKLQKVFPVLTYKSLSRNEYWVYKVVKVVLRCREIRVVSPLDYLYNRETNLDSEKNQLLMKHKRSMCKVQISKTNKILAKMASKPIHMSLI